MPTSRSTAPAERSATVFPRSTGCLEAPRTFYNICHKISICFDRYNYLKQTPALIKKACKDSLLKSLQAFFILIPSKLYTDYIIFTPLLQPALRFFWISLRPISDSQLHALPHFHLCPIYLIVSKGSYVIPHGISHLKGGFTLRCLQRLSLPNLATRLCHWCDNR